MKTLSIMIVCVIFMGCASFFKNIQDYQPLTNTVYELATAAYIKDGNCIPTELRTVVIPIFIKLSNELDKDTVKISDVKNLLLPLVNIYEKDPVMATLIKSGVNNLVDVLTKMGCDSDVLSGQNLGMTRAIIDLDLAGLEASAGIADIYDSWCK